MRGGGNCQVPGPPSSPTSIYTPAPCPATYFWSMPAGRAPAGSAGRRPHPAWWQRPLVRPALTSPRPCRHPSQAAARLQPTDRPGPPRPALSHQRCSALGSAGLRRVEEGTPRPEGVGGAPGAEPAGPLGNPAGSGDPERRKRSPGPRGLRIHSRWARPGEGPGLGLAGVKLDPFNSEQRPVPRSRTILDALGDTEATHSAG